MTTSTNRDDMERRQIKEELSSMSFAELIKLKERLGSKMYEETMFGGEAEIVMPEDDASKFKRLNKNRPREETAKRPVPFYKRHDFRNVNNEMELRDPRFDEQSGTYNTNVFKKNYKFLADIRSAEITQYKKQLNKVNDMETRKEMKLEMQRLVNKNHEDANWFEKQSELKQEQAEIAQAKSEGRRPHYTTKKERKAKELVKKFEALKKSGKLWKHVEKKRKKNSAKDRKKFSFD